MNTRLEIGQPTGESIRMEFTGSEGFIIVFAHEDGGQEIGSVSATLSKPWCVSRRSTHCGGATSE